MTVNDYRTVFQAGVSAAMTEVCAALRECDGTADDMYLRAQQRIAGLERPEFAQ